MGKSKEKINNGCIKIFKLLTLLYENNASYNNVIDIFKDELDEQSSNNLQVVLNKNLNTLKVFGIKVKKENHRYLLDSSFYAVDFTLEDLKSISILLNSCESFPDKDCCKSIHEMINNFMFRMSNENRNLLSNLTQNYNFGFYYSDMRDQIDRCKKICDSHQQCEVIYLKNKKNLKCRCTPKGIIYGSRTAFLECYDINKNEKIEIPLNNILEITELPQVAGKTENATTVVFKVKNRLSKSYKLKENEQSQGFDDEGNQVIINRNEPFDRLISRLMRYNFNCEIISPKSLRNDMINRINDTLSNYK